MASTSLNDELLQCGQVPQEAEFARSRTGERGGVLPLPEISHVDVCSPEFAQPWTKPDASRVECVAIQNEIDESEVVQCWPDWL